MKWKYHNNSIKLSLFCTLMLMIAIISAGCKDGVISGLSDSSAAGDSLQPESTPSYVYTSLDPPLSTASDSDFKVFDGTRLNGKPDMEQYGFTPLEIVYAVRLWTEDLADVPIDELPDPDLLHQQTERAANTNPNIAMLDIEHWPNVGDYYDDVLPTVKKTYRVIDRMQKVKPNLHLGYFGMVPVKNFSSNLSTYRLDKWRHKNHYLRPLADKVDAFFLKGYTYWQDRSKWAENLKNNIAEARRLASSVGDDNKPVYVVLWPRYYWGFDYDSSLNGTYFDADYWKFQLDTVRKYADGVVIWSKAKTDFDSSAPWWDVTTAFLQDLGKN